MSYNIDSIRIIWKQDFQIPVTRYEDLKSRFLSEAPVSSIFDDKWPEWKGNGWLRTGEWNRIKDGNIIVSQFWWCGEGSGTSFQLLLRVLAEFDGQAHLVLTWAGGGSHSGLQLQDHKVTEHKVLFALGDEVCQ